MTVSPRADAPAGLTVADRAQAIVENARNALTLLLRLPGRKTSSTNLPVLGLKGTPHGSPLRTRLLP